MTARLLDAANRRARRFAEGNMDACVRIGRPDPDGPDTSVVPSPAVMLLQLYEGRARIAAVPGGGQGEVGEELVFMSTGRVSVPVCVVDVQVDDLVEVVSHFDQMVVGRVWRVVGVGVGGSLEAVRSLTVSIVKRHSNWTWVSGGA